MISVRSATSGDADAVLLTWLAAGSVPTVSDDAPSIEQLIDCDPNALVVAVDGQGQIVGTVIAGWDGWRGNVYRLAVVPGWRRQGVGRALVVEAERRMTARGAVRMSAIVEDANGTANEFWSAAGYSLLGDQSRYVRNLSGG